MPSAEEEVKRKRENGYTSAAPAAEVVRALLVAWSRTYTLGRTFDLGSARHRGQLGDLSSPTARKELWVLGNVEAGD